MKVEEKVWNLFNNEGGRETPMLLNVFMPMRSFWWVQLYLNLFKHLAFHNQFIWYTTRYTMRQTRVPPHVIKSTKLRGVQRSPELAFRRKDFCVPENRIFPVLAVVDPVSIPEKTATVRFFGIDWIKSLGIIS